MPPPAFKKENADDGADGTTTAGGGGASLSDDADTEFMKEKLLLGSVPAVEMEVEGVASAAASSARAGTSKPPNAVSSPPETTLRPLNMCVPFRMHARAACPSPQWSEG